MTTLREAAQQALDALEVATTPRSEDRQTVLKAQAALRAALADQSEQALEMVNPVAWIQPDHLQKARRAPFLCRVEPTKRRVDFVPLYTTPPQRQLLTDAEIARVMQPFESVEPEHPFWVNVTRAIERAHGIGGEE